MSAPNPWFKDCDSLDSSDVLLDGENALDIIRDLLLEWPGDETVKIDDKSRHKRLVQTIAGYPEIDVVRYPLDWPLNKNAVKALRLTHYLDTIQSPDKSTSLRSALLNKSSNMKSLGGKEFEAAHRRLLSILLLGLRATNDDEESHHQFLVTEQKMLVALHSNHQSRVITFWPWSELSRTINSDWGVWNSENYLPHISSGSLPGKYCIGWTNNDDISFVKPGIEIGVKLQKIQKWISNWSDNFLKMSLESTLIRGASAILESIMSTLRHSIIAEYGVESIIIDGGGRLVFMGDDKSREILEQSFINIFNMSNQRPYYNHELSTVVRTLSGKSLDDKLSFEDYGLIYGTAESEVHETQINLRTKSWVEKHLPKLAITEGGIPYDDLAFEPIIGDENCCICNENVPITGNKSDRDGQIKDLQKPFCVFHRLLYHIGISQRMVDSTTKGRGKPFIFEGGKERRVLGIARLDLNSLGVLFTSQYLSEEENSIDIRRRRSIRFNSQWWEIVDDVLDSDKYELDRIVAWVAAGDDIILADYSPTVQKVPGKLVKILQDLSSRLDNLSDAEYSPFRLSFGAGVSTLDGDANSITHMMDLSHDAEIIAKSYWKDKMHSDQSKHWIITDSEGEIKKYQKPKIKSSNIIEPFDSIIYIDSKS